MSIHDYIKILYVNMGYLPNYPFYLISDKEMFDAFLKEDGVFADYYPCPGEEFTDSYNELLSYITFKIDNFMETEEEIPDWVYSYMIIRPITYQSPEEDIRYLCDMANIDFDNKLPEFNEEVAKNCYSISKKWIQKLPSKYAHRPPTMFGETHVTKSLRLDQANILISTD